MKISLVVPVYNSETIILKLINEIEKILHNNKYEIILVNDYSADNSWNVIKDICKKNKYIKGIALTKNFGQHSALMAGLNFASGDIIITIDDDLQHPPNSILDLINKISYGYELCYTNYINRQHNFYKILLSKMSNIISSIIINKPFSLYLSSFKCMNSDIKNKLIKIKNPNIYIDGCLLRLTKKITSINISHNKRYAGSSNYNLKKLFQLWLNLTLVTSFYPLRPSSALILIIKLFVSPFMIYRLIFEDKNKIQFQILEKTF